MNLLTIFYVVIVGVSFLFSLNSFRLNFNFQLKIFSALLGLTFIVELSSIVIPRILHIKNNMWLYNSFTLVEFWVYGLYYRIIIQIEWIKKMVVAFLLLFPPFWLITVFFVFGFTAWNSYVIVVGAIFTVFCAISYYYQLLVEEKVVKLSNHSEFWIATGMLILYSCQIPYFGMLNYLVQNYLPLAKKLMNVITILNILMYSTFIYAYLCRTSTEKY